MADHGQKRAAALLALAGLLFVLAGLTLLASMVGLAVAAPLLLLLSPILFPAALLACALATGAAASGALALGALSILSRQLLLLRKPPDDDECMVEQGKRRIGEVAEVAGERTPHAALAVVSRGQGATDHKKPQNYEHYVAGRMVHNA